MGDLVNCLDCSNLKIAILRYKLPLSYNIYKQLSIKSKHILCNGGSFRAVFCTKKDILLVMPPTCKSME